MLHPILLYDGVCGLCNRFVQFILRRDRNAIFRFASLQGAPAARILARHSDNPIHLETVYVILDHELPNESLLSRSEAVLFVLKELPGPSRVAAFVLRMFPKFLRDAVYNAIARRRYRFFGRSATCAIPGEQDHNRFLDR